MEGGMNMGPWQVLERKLSDGSSVFSVHFLIDPSTRRYAGEVVIEAVNEGAAFDARDAMNLATAQARGLA